MAADGSVVILIEGDDSDLKSKLNNIGDIASGAAKAAAAAIAAATTAIGAFAKASLDTGMQFDSAMSQVAATMGTTVDQIQELRDFAMEMGASTAFSANEAAEALNYMALAGYDAETAMSMLPTVLDLAAAGGVDLASASDMVTDAQSALGLSIEETAEMVDKMAEASSKSNTSVAQLGEAILTIGGTAKNMAGGTTELSAALGILADNGVKGAEGGTALRNIILSLSAPTDTAAAAMKSLGLEVFDAEGNMRPLNDAFSDLNTALSSMTQGEQTQVLSKIFNKVDLKSVNALLANTGERFDELSEYIENSAGAAEKMANTQLDNLAGDVTLFKSALKGAQIVLSDQLTPNLREFVQFGSEGISKIASAFQEGGLTGAMEAFGAVLSDGLNIVIEQLPSMVDAGMQLLEALGQGIIDNIPTVTSAALEIVSSLVAGVVEALPQLAQTGTDIILQLAQSVIDGLPGMVPAAVQTIATLVEQITGNLSQIIDAGIQVIVALGEGIIEALPDLIEKVPEIVSNIANVINDNAPKLLAAAAKLIVELGKGLIENIPTLIANIPKIIQAIADAWSAFNWLNLGQKAITAIKDGILKIVPAVKTAGKNVLDAVVNAIKSLPQTLMELGRNGVSGLANTIRNLASTARSAMGDLVSGVLEAIKNLPDKMLDIGKNIVAGIADGIKNGAASAINAVADLAGNLVDSAKDFLGIRSPSRVMEKEVGPYIPQGVAVGVEKEIPRTERTVAEQMADLTNRVRAAVEAETASISVGLTTRGGGGDPAPAPGGGLVINVYVDGGAAESVEKARNMGRELGAEAAREMRRRGAVPA